MSAWALIGVSFVGGIAVAAMSIIVLAMVWKRAGHDVRCPKCDPDVAVLAIRDGAWFCLACGHEWHDPDLMAAWQARQRGDVH